MPGSRVALLAANQTMRSHPTPLRLRMDTVPPGTSSTITLSGVTYQDVPSRGSG